MHEVGIMESALALVQRHADERGASCVHRVVLRVGALSGVDPDSLRFAFEVVARGTRAEGATLVLDLVPTLVYCSSCRCEFAGDRGAIFTCPQCGDLCGEIRSGRELELSRIEMS
ncbi:MAG: hydrogenase maturation nickel metallochaperone HypA [Opitutaceae bacterium]|nr:hydrogenase maturation nickel metallochaperone HypA [Opitutaceae bacterium]